MNVTNHFFQPICFRKDILTTLSSHKTAILIVAAAALCCVALLFWAVSRNHKLKPSQKETPIVRHQSQPSHPVPKSNASKDQKSLGTKPVTGGLFRQDDQKPQTTSHSHVSMQYTGQYAYAGSINGQNISIAGDHLKGISVHLNGSLIEKIDYQTFMQNGYRRKLNGVDIHISAQGQKAAQKGNKQPQNSPTIPIGRI